MLDIGILLENRPGRPLSVLHVALKPFSRHPPLWHSKTSEFFIVLKGGVRAMINGRSRRLKKDDFVFLPPGTIHEFHTGKRGVEALAVFVPGLNLNKPDIILRKPRKRAARKPRRAR